MYVYTYIYTNIFAYVYICICSAADLCVFRFYFSAWRFHPAANRNPKTKLARRPVSLAATPSFQRAQLSSRGAAACSFVDRSCRCASLLKLNRLTIIIIIKIKTNGHAYLCVSLATTTNLSWANPSNGGAAGAFVDRSCRCASY